MEVDAEYPVIRSRLTREAQEELAPLVALILADAWKRQDIDDARWSGPLTLLLADVGRRTAADIGPRLLATLKAADAAWAVEGTRNYLLTVAGNISGAKLAEARKLLRAADPELFEEILGRAAELVESTPELMVDTAANFTVNDVAEVTGVAQKQWKVNSSNPRPEHAAMSGQTVPVGENFSNGLRYPRGGGGPEQTANCKCSMVVITEGGQ